MAKVQRTRSATAADARLRLWSAQAFLEVAELVLVERSRVEMPGVAAGLAVLAGIAASDAICARRLGEIHRGADHHGAAALLRGATPDGKKLADVFQNLISVKDEAHYGLMLVEQRKAGNAVRWATRLVDRAREECER